ncbi:hypothetical protein M514_10677 [Trichuris suis]|uniref:Uncharacterized protein n=1 Tax=Trichuris suis TaxID=68888 RepID=A0A085LU13_9BILA|nr:hypothetical protein M513_10677 [Trichuris suis]KFD62118.1 hypothetical protein M514_25720 [Trichuris suis]KFD62122.1 hypothetical protein M514_10677 [Trichuris suis]
MLDLEKAYPQVHVDKPLWPYQTMMIKGRRYCLIRVCSDLNVVSLFLPAVLACAVSLDLGVKRGSSACTDDV